MPESQSSYRPSAWSGTAPIYIQSINSDGSLGQSYVFDCYHSISIVSELKKTQHPVQTGGNISDHAFLIPVSINLDIGMSDVGVSFSPSMWSGSSPSKSVQAYNVLQGFQQARNFLSFTCKLGTFNNLLVDRIAPQLNYKTITGLRASVVLGQTFLVDITAQAVSARPTATSGTSQGSQNTVPVPPTTTSNNSAPSTDLQGNSKTAFTNTNASTQQSFIGSVTSSGSSLFKSFGQP